MTAVKVPVEAGHANIISDLFAGITADFFTTLAGVNPLNGPYWVMVGIARDCVVRRFSIHVRSQ